MRLGYCSLAEEIDAAMAEAVNGLRARRYCWAEIAPYSTLPARLHGSAGEQCRDLWRLSIPIFDASNQAIPGTSAKAKSWRPS
jgi:hypothetical protein